MNTQRLIAGIWLLAGFALAAQADTLRLRSGARVNGSYLGGSADEVRFMVNDEVERYPRADVVEIDFAQIGGISEGLAAPAPKVDLGPDVAGIPYLRGANGYIALEREMGMMGRQGGMYGMGGSVYRVQGGRSPVRVRQGDRIVFVVRQSGSIDARQFQLYRLEPRAGYRQTQPAMGGMPASIPLAVSRVSDGVFEITPGQRLYPGEYAVSPMNSNESYCFGVDY